MGLAMGVTGIIQAEIRNIGDGLIPSREQHSIAQVLKPHPKVSRHCHNLLALLASLTAVAFYCLVGL
jgi:hypothetical protein